MDAFKKYLPYFFMFFLLVDALYSFVQHTQVELDGDMSAIILPIESYQKVLDDPFGLSVLLNHESYAAPNRFFAHWSMSTYFKTLPHFFQYLVSPIDSIYWTAAFAKTLIQLGMIYILALYISREKNLFRYSWLLAAVLITPLLQTSGFNGLMGIIDKSVTYTFFYAFSMVLVLFFFYPFFNALVEKRTLSLSMAGHGCLILLSVVLPFHGPLVPGVVIMVCSMTMVYLFYDRYVKQEATSVFEKITKSIADLPRVTLFYFLGVGILCLYSLYIGMSNSENDGAIPLVERYARIPNGLFELFTQKIGLPIVLIVLLVNMVLIKKFQQHDEASQKMLRWFKALAWFSFIYILILPLGGYRAYRPDIVRRDTIMPVLLILFYMYGYSSYYLLQQGVFKYKRVYYGFIALVLFIFTISDKPIPADNACEKEALKVLVQSPQPLVELSSACHIMAWQNITDPQQSATNTALLQYWGVLSSPKLYYQK